MRANKALPKIFEDQLNVRTGYAGPDHREDDQQEMTKRVPPFPDRLVGVREVHGNSSALPPKRPPMKAS